MTFDEFIASCLADSANGYDGPPCPACGCLVTMRDPAPFCLRCARAVEDFVLLHEQAYTSLSRMWDMLAELPSTRRAQAHEDCSLLVELAMRVWQATGVRA